MVNLIRNFIRQTIGYLTVYGLYNKSFLITTFQLCLCFMCNRVHRWDWADHHFDLLEENLSDSLSSMKWIEQFVTENNMYSVGCAVHELGTTLYFFNTFNFFLSNFLKEFMLMIMSELNFERMFQTQGLCLSFYKYNSFRFFRGCFQPCLAGISTLHIFRSQFEP